MKYFDTKYLTCILAVMICFFASTIPAQEDALVFLNPDHPKKIPLDFQTRPELGCWFLMDPQDFQGDGCQKFLDAVAFQGAFNLFSTSTRHDIEVVDKSFHDMMKNAAHYAHEKYGTGLLLDLDVRLARRAFEQKYPHALQEKLVYLEKTVSNQGDTAIEFQAQNLGDHYTYNSVPYLIRGHRFIKAWSYLKGDQNEIIPNSLKNITTDVTMESKSDNQVILHYVNPDNFTKEENPRFICGVVAFSYLSPDVFAPELITFEKEILQQYADVPLAGACKDEWGFPPDFGGNLWKNEYWYSEAMQKHYAKLNPGRKLIDDCFLMALPQQGKTEERINVIDAYNRCCFWKNVEVESEYAKTIKEVFGPLALPATHATWWPWPDSREFVKNQLSWWKVPRDMAQTDECTPYFCRTSLAKQTNTAWYNMFYSSDINEYIPETWGAVLAAGRINIHPVYPAAAQGDMRQQGFNMMPILDTGLGEAREKIRLLDFITHSPVDSPVAVVFGHFGSMNWARPGYNKLGTSGIEFCNHIAVNGYPVDMIPSSQADSGYWTSDKDGYLKYGVQKYSVVVFWGETDSDKADYDTIRTIATDCEKTKIVDMDSLLSSSNMKNFADEILEQLRAKEVQPQTAWYPSHPWGGFPMARPPRIGKARYVDGTLVWISAEKNPAGDNIVLRNEKIMDAPTQPTVSISASGIFACRFAENGTLDALAAGALQQFVGGGISIDLTDQPTDIALWKNSDGTWNGLIQSKENRLPENLKKLPHIRWKFLEKQ